MDGQIYGRMDRRTNRPTGIQTDRHTDEKPTERQLWIDRWTNGHPGKHTNVQIEFVEVYDVEF